MNVNHLTCYYDPERGDMPFCVDVDYPDNEDGTRSTGNDGFRFNTPQAAGKYVADWLTLAPRRQLKRTDVENQALADLAFTKFDFGWQIKDASGWEHVQGACEFDRTVFVENEDDPTGPSLRKRFHVEVRDGMVFATLEDHECSESWKIDRDNLLK